MFIMLPSLQLYWQTQQVSQNTAMQMNPQVDNDGSSNRLVNRKLELYLEKHDEGYQPKVQTKSVFFVFISP